MTAPTKKSQTVINAVAESALALQAEASRLQQLLDRISASGESFTGTLMESRIAALTTWVGNVQSVATAAVPTYAIANAVQTHRGEAL